MTLICGRSTTTKWNIASTCRHSLTGGGITLIGVCIYLFIYFMTNNGCVSAAQAQSRIKILEKVNCSCPVGWLRVIHLYYFSCPSYNHPRKMKRRSSSKYLWDIDRWYRYLTTLKVPRNGKNLTTLTSNVWSDIRLFSGKDHLKKCKYWCRSWFTDCHSRCEWSWQVNTVSASPPHEVYILIYMLLVDSIKVLTGELSPHAGYVNRNGRLRM